ncbi:hypothetical protein CSKR_102498 [Clonorchis sinensis]|uniref:Uncharacterized protein n=1 Tax=Clonorchis sinensis TaxID=79923 RepID=A0A419QEX4_CLOSI|nr:hypothetical protein CSKR_102498 [Clonorchis sinensis]
MHSVGCSSGSRFLLLAVDLSPRCSRSGRDSKGGNEIPKVEWGAHRNRRSCGVHDQVERPYELGEVAQWLERQFSDRTIHGSNPTSASRLPLSRLGEPDSIPDHVLPWCGMVVRHWNGTTAERKNLANR